MRRPTLVAVLPLALALSGAVVPPASAADPAEVALLPDDDWNKGWARAGGETAEHVLVTSDATGTPVATLYATGGSTATKIGDFPHAVAHPLQSPRLFGGVLAVPSGGNGTDGPATVTFRTIASAAQQTVTIDHATNERLVAYVSGYAVLVGEPDGTDPTLTDLFLRTPVAEELVIEDASLNAASASVFADAAGALLYDGDRTLMYADFASKGAIRVDDAESAADDGARPQYLGAFEIGYRTPTHFVRVPRDGEGDPVRVPLDAPLGVTRRAGDRLVTAAYVHPEYQLHSAPVTGGTGDALLAHLTSHDIAEYGTEIAAFGHHNGRYGRIAVDPITSTVRMLAALPSPPSPPRSVALSGGRLYVADDAVRGGRVTESRLDPNAAALAFLPRRVISGTPWAAATCNGAPCAPTQAFAGRLAFLRANSPYGPGATLVVADGWMPILELPVMPTVTWFQLGGTHLLYESEGERRLVDLSTGAATASTLRDVWGRYGYGVDGSGNVQRVDLGTGAVEIARAADACTVTGVAGRGAWVRWTAACAGGTQHMVRNVVTGATVTVPAWATELGDGIAVGWNGLTLTAVDLTASGAPQTAITTGQGGYPQWWSVDATAGRLVAWHDLTDATVRVRRLGAASAPELVSQDVAPRATIGKPWDAAFHYSGAGVDWTLTVAEGTPASVVTGGSTWDGVVRPQWAPALPVGTYPYRLSVVPRDGSAAPADVTGTVAVVNPAALALTAPVKVTYGATVPLAATLTSAGAPVAGEQVRFERRARFTTAWQPVATVPTDAAGKATTGHVPTADVEYRAVHDASGNYAAATTGAQLVRVAARITLRVTPAAALNGTTITLSGSVAPVSSGQVTLQRYGKGWSSVARLTLTNGAFSGTVRPSATGRYRYRVTYAATPDDVVGISNEVTYSAYRVTVTKVDAVGEYAVLTNTGPFSVNLRDWVLDAGYAQRSRLPSYVLGAGRSVRVRTFKGTTGAGVIYLGRTHGIWAAHDVARLYDPRGALSSRYAY